jgi:hypothetical protein
MGRRGTVGTGSKDPIQHRVRIRRRDVNLKQINVRSDNQRLSTAYLRIVYTLASNRKVVGRVALPGYPR